MRIKRIYPKSKTILPQPPIHAKGEAGVSHKLGIYGIGRTPELNDLIYGKGVIDGQEH